MARRYFIPGSGKKKVIWLRSFHAKFTRYASAFGFTESDVISLGNDCAAYAYHTEAIEILQREVKNYIFYKNMLADGPQSPTVIPLRTMPVLPPAPPPVPAGIFKRVVSIINRIKAHPDYTEAIGKELGIVGPLVMHNTTLLQPKLNLHTSGRSVIIKYKRGDNDGIFLYSKRGDEKEFKLLHVISKVIYRDERPNLVPNQPEKRTYKAQYVKKDELVGQVSEEASIGV